MNRLGLKKIYRSNTKVDICVVTQHSKVMVKVWTNKHDKKTIVVGGHLL